MIACTIFSLHFPFCQVCSSMKCLDLIQIFSFDQKCFTGCFSGMSSPPFDGKSKDCPLVECLFIQVCICRKFHLVPAQRSQCPLCPSHHLLSLLSQNVVPCRWSVEQMTIFQTESENHRFRAFVILTQILMKPNFLSHWLENFNNN